MMQPEPRPPRRPEPPPAVEQVAAPKLQPTVYCPSRSEEVRQAR